MLVVRYAIQYNTMQGAENKTISHAKHLNVFF